MSFLKRMKEKLMGGPSKEEVKEPEQQVEEVVETEEPAQAELPAVEEGKEQEVVEETTKPVEEETVETVQEEKQEVAIVEEVKDEPEAEKESKGWFRSAFSITEKFKSGLTKTRDSFTSKVNDLVARYRTVDEDFFEELEEVLLQADVGFETVMELTEILRYEVQKKNIKSTDGIQALISEKLVEIYEKAGDDHIELNLQPKGELTVILFVGVNGVGKTTTIGKLAHRLKSEGRSVMLAAGDTFRAGAIDQLQVWGDRVG
ncbi:MAG: signal recognition particle receptor subunit alpha, partial [Kurthia sp.]|nr:signal recognition particle receptor subunit alpha [Kurthia sp.]